MKYEGKALGDQIFWNYWGTRHAMWRGYLMVQSRPVRGRFRRYIYIMRTWNVISRTNYLENEVNICLRFQVRTWFISIYFRFGCLFLLPGLSASSGCSIFSPSGLSRFFPGTRRFALETPVMATYPATTPSPKTWKKGHTEILTLIKTEDQQRRWYPSYCEIHSSILTISHKQRRVIILEGY